MFIPGKGFLAVHMIRYLYLYFLTTYKAYLGTSEMQDRRMRMNIWLICWNQCINAAYLRECQVNPLLLMRQVWYTKSLVVAFVVR
jgi:hypothetical protein